MAYSSTNPPLMLLDGAGPLAPRMFVYSSTHTSTEIIATGFFAAAGDGSRSLYGIGLRKGDILINRASTDSSVPGKTSWHSVVNTTANVASTSASSGWNAAYDATVSATS